MPASGCEAMSAGSPLETCRTVAVAAVCTWVGLDAA